MNVVETIGKELDGKNYDDLQKLRYIYIRCCQLFYFDARWSVSPFLGDNLKEQIYNKKINLEDVKDNSVICHTFAREVLIPLLKYYTNLNPIHLENKEHSIVAVNSLYGEDYKLDATRGDLSRLKLDLEPIGMIGSISDTPRSFRKLDKKLGLEFVDRNYYLSLITGKNKREQLRSVGFLLDDYDNIKDNYADTNFLFNMCTSFLYCDDNTYFDRDYNFHRLIIISYPNSSLYYDISKDDEYYTLKEIDKDKHEYLIKTLIKKPQVK